VFDGPLASSNGADGRGGEGCLALPASVATAGLLDFAVCERGPGGPVLGARTFGPGGPVLGATTFGGGGSGAAGLAPFEVGAPFSPGRGILNTAVSSASVNRLFREASLGGGSSAFMSFDFHEPFSAGGAMGADLLVVLGASFSEEPRSVTVVPSRLKTSGYF